MRQTLTLLSWVDLGGGTHCGQSMWDSHGRRIQFMWLGLRLNGAAWIGAQTIPREITLAPAGSVTGLWFSPIPEMATLHTTTAPDLDENVSLVPGPASRRVFVPTDGLHCHIKAVVTIPADQQQSCTVTLTVRDGEDAQKPSQGSLAIGVVHTKDQRTVTFGTKTATVSSSGSDEITIEIFVDGPVRGLFVHADLIRLFRTHVRTFSDCGILCERR